ncbi:uncharacterized protein N0V89_000513 [Didymosphaeria variabile]|uniref:Uncharacterized protein n=1 Tax=Didymosphaeria variabile TaxID=1932322 RepID=A0A9W8XXJ3_9PLEO|nr:uncharacterized protein N0V89_000513 [Didymosphaeria variabile]KAJ4359954.1 hypothetical protein N0V89_000513 [Didymosphaeria variabile]
MRSKQLLNELIELARQEATEQFQDVWHLSANTEEQEPGVHLQLDFRDHADRGGRYIGELRNATGLNRNNREGEYKFWDESNLKLFWRVDGMPTAARALLYTMRKKHEICETPDVWMGFVGSIDEELGPAKPCRLRLQSILGPLKFWDKLSEKYSGPDELLEGTEGELSASYCQPFWSFAIEVIRCAPHMLKAGYKTKRNGKSIKRCSWARLLVLLFLPREDLMQELVGAGLAPKNPPAGWHQQAREQMKEALMQQNGVKLRASIRNGWDDLCRELDKLYFDSDLYTDFPIPQPPLRSASEDEQVLERLQDENRDVEDTQGKEAEIPNANQVSSAESITPTTPHYPRYQHRPPAAVQGTKKRNLTTSESEYHDIANEEKSRQRKKQRALPRRPTRWDFSDDDDEVSQYHVLANYQLSRSLEQDFQDHATKGIGETSSNHDEKTASQKESQTKEAPVAEDHKSNETPKEKDIARPKET